MAISITSIYIYCIYITNMCTAYGAYTKRCDGILRVDSSTQLGLDYESKIKSELSSKVKWWLGTFYELNKQMNKQKTLIEAGALIEAGDFALFEAGALIEAGDLHYLRLH